MNIDQTIEENLQSVKLAVIHCENTPEGGEEVWEHYKGVIEEMMKEHTVEVLDKILIDTQTYPDGGQVHDYIEQVKEKLQ